MKVRDLTPEEFEKAIEIAKHVEPQATKADYELSYLNHNGTAQLYYDPFPGDWRLSTAVNLAGVKLDSGKVFTNPDGIW
jgi:hypothetical protein